MMLVTRRASGMPCCDHQVGRLKVTRDLFMNISSFSDVLILMLAATIQLIIGVALIRAGQKFYKKSSTEQSGRFFWKISSMVVSIWGWCLVLWSVVYTVSQIIRNI
jgi:hypothetical protein